MSLARSLRPSRRTAPSAGTSTAITALSAATGISVSPLTLRARMVLPAMS
jgi:hypothetical protein